MLFPFRAKNPPDRVPVATFGLIIINCIVFLCTQRGGEIKYGVMQDWGASYHQLTFPRLFASMYLHESPEHLIGNMLFLWIFGAAVEGRLKPLKYLILYHVSGIAGAIVQALVFAKIAPNMYGIGASGAIMGLGGASMYIFPYATVCLFYWVRILPAYAEWATWCIVLYYIALDVANGLLWQGRDGIGHLVHITGCIVGFLMAMAFRPHRDSQMISEVQTTRANLFNDLDIMSASELDTLLENPTDNLEMVIKFCEKAIAQPGTYGEKDALKRLNEYKDKFMARGDVEQFARLLLRIPKESGTLPPTFYLRLGSKLESLTKYELAVAVYRRIYDVDPSSADAGAAIMRFGRIWETVYRNKDMARDAYETYLNLHSKGSLVLEAQAGIDRLGGRKTVVAMHREGVVNRVSLNDDQFEAPPAIALSDSLKEPTEVIHAIAYDPVPDATYRRPQPAFSMPPAIDTPEPAVSPHDLAAALALADDTPHSPQWPSSQNVTPQEPALQVIGIPNDDDFATPQTRPAASSPQSTSDNNGPNTQPVDDTPAPKVKFSARRRIEID